VSQINPFAGSILQATNVQRAQAAEKDRALQKARERQKSSAHGLDQFEHQVESVEAVAPLHDDEASPEPRSRRRKKKAGLAKPQGDPENPRLDLRA